MLDDSEVAVKGFLGSTYYMKIITHYDFFQILFKTFSSRREPLIPLKTSSPSHSLSCGVVQLVLEALIKATPDPSVSP